MKSKDPDGRYSNKYFDKHYEGGYETQANNPVFAKKFKETVSLGLKKGKVLDVGCAYGYFLKPFIEAGFDSYGVDVSKHAIKTARKLFPEATFKVCNIDTSHLPFADNFFDSVIQIFLLEHVENYYQTLKECHRVLKKGGILFIYIPTERRWYGDETHINIFTTKSLSTTLERLEFRVVKIGEEGGRFQNLFGAVRLIKNRHTMFNFVPSKTGSFISCHAIKV